MELPLSFAQKRIWFYQQLAPYDPFYNICFKLKILGELDFTLLELALNKMIQRHEILRTSFELNAAGIPQQKIHEDLKFELIVVDMHTVPNPNDKINKYLQQQDRPFNLAQLPLFKFNIFQLEKAVNVLTFNIHQIIFDDWSTSIFIQELDSIYNQLKKDVNLELPSLSYQYSDFVKRQEENLNGEAFNQQLDYWSKRLEGSEFVLKLPTDAPRPKVMEHKGALFQFEIPIELVQQLRNFEKQQHLDLSVILYSVFALLVYRYTNQEDILIGIPVSGRTTSDLQNVLGCFINILVIRTQFDPNMSFNTLLTQIAKNFQEALANQDLPFGKLLEHLKLERPADATPVFQILFNMEHIPEISNNLFSSHTELEMLHNPRADFDLVFEVAEFADHIRIDLTYRTKLFQAETIKRFTDNWLYLLRHIVETPEREIKRLPVLSPEEEKLLVLDFNKTEVHFENKDCVHQMIASVATNKPNNIAIKFKEITLTYQELNAKVNQLGAYFISLGVKKGDPIIVMLERTPELIISMLALFKIGAIYIPVGTTYPNERIETIINDSQAKYIVGDNDERTFSISYLSFKSIIEKAQQFSNADIKTQINFTDIAYIIYTSGSTGKPKGVMVNHGGLNNTINWYHDYFKFSDQDVISQINNPSFDVFFGDSLPALTSGGILKIVPEEIKMTPTLLLTWLADEQITICDLPTAYAQVLFNLTWPANIKLRLLKIGGENLGKYPDQQFNFDIYNMYGPTENTIDTTCACLYKAADKNNPPVFVTIGKALANVKLYVVDQDLKPVPIGAPGELVVGGAGLASGYLNQPVLTAQKFVANPFDATGHSKLYKTGDVVRWLNDGTLQFIGRVDNQIKYLGHRIELEEIEKSILKLTGVKHAAVILREDNSKGKTLVAYIVPDFNQIRFDYETPCKVILQDKSYQMKIKNISASGVKLECNEVDWVDKDEVSISLTSPIANENLQFAGQVIWHENKIAGIKFNNDSEEQFSKLMAAIYYLQSLKDYYNFLASKKAPRNISQALATILPRYMIPTSYVYLEKLPFTPNGKVDRKALPVPSNDQIYGNAQDRSPFTGLEASVAKIWQSLLNVRHINANDNFFDLGGNSLLMMQVQIKLQEMLQKNISIVDLFKYPTISSLVKFLTNLTPQQLANHQVQSGLRRTQQRSVMLKVKISPPSTHTHLNSAATLQTRSAKQRNAMNMFKTNRTTRELNE